MRKKLIIVILFSMFLIMVGCKEKEAEKAEKWEDNSPAYNFYSLARFKYYLVCMV
ncbi:hypothetical protein GCM10008025_36580 [Ornithinibacillus halotolerans]|uniref:Lipoprotein n=1 Tax=Ornithinibacillus halotolerans TaxID=1274357 RepID=A0A916S9I7_9BACI|nr:hypothetical protein GCM10008025_36580 [Ornithinibacillus halotolerans]